MITCNELRSQEIKRILGVEEIKFDGDGIAFKYKEKCYVIDTVSDDSDELYLSEVTADAFTPLACCVDEGRSFQAMLEQIK